MIPRYRYAFGFLCVAFFLSVAGCGPAQHKGFSFSLSFADMGQAQTGSGIPQDVKSIRLTAYSQFDENLASDCIALSEETKQRQSVSLDLPPGSGIKLEVQGWNDSECGGRNPSGNPPWFGAASDVVVSEGRQTPVVLQIRRMGNHLNLLRENLRTPRVFGTATYLDNDEVLLAGGFSVVGRKEGTASILQAACNAEIVDVASAAVKRVVPMQSCRGLHQAFKLSDGRVVLVGGCQEAIFDPTGSIRPIVRPKVDSLIQSVEIYDPVTKEFKVLSVQTITMRADSSGALLSDGTLLLAGGRTSTMRSSDVLSANPSASNPEWSVRTNGMLAERTGAVAVLRDSGLLVIGGNLPNEPDVELLPSTDKPSSRVELNGQQYSLALSGHALDDVDGNLIISGGIPNESGSVPSSQLFWGTMDGDGLSLLANSLVRPRAYHSTGIVGCSDGRACVAVFGGLDSSMKSVKDVELVRANSDGQLLSDSLETGAVGTLVTSLPDGSVLVTGGLDVSVDGAISLSSAGQILTP